MICRNYLPIASPQSSRKSRTLICLVDKCIQEIHDKQITKTQIKKSIRNWITISVQSLFATFTIGLQKYSSFGFSFKTLCSRHFLKLPHRFSEPYKCNGRNVAGRLNINKMLSACYVNTDRVLESLFFFYMCTQLIQPKEQHTK